MCGDESILCLVKKFSIELTSFCGIDMDIFGRIEDIIGKIMIASIQEIQRKLFLQLGGIHI